MSFAPTPALTLIAAICAASSCTPAVVDAPRKAAAPSMPLAAGAGTPEKDSPASAAAGRDAPSPGGADTDGEAPPASGPLSESPVSGGPSRAAASACSEQPPQDFLIRSNYAYKKNVDRAEAD